MATIQPIRFVGLLLVVVGVMLFANSASSEPTENDARGTVYSVTYAIWDLPVYRPGKNGAEFDPSVLISHFKKSIAPASWKTHADIAVFPQNLSLVVTQTETNHAKLADLLKSLREKKAE